MNHLISVIIPIYNMEKYIERCVDSVINQSYKELEIILVDDGSTDHSPEICDQYKRIDERVVVIHKNNGGLVSARKAGIQNSKGEYIVYVDADDYISESFIEVFNGIALKTSADFIQCRMMVEYDNQPPMIIDDDLEEGLYYPNEDEFFLTYKIFGSSEYGINRLRSNLWSCMFRRELIYDIQTNVDNEITNGEDDACYYPCVLCANTYYYIKEPLYYHYERNHSMSRDVEKFNASDVNKINKMIFPFVRAHKHQCILKKSYNEYIERIYFRHLYMGTGIKVDKYYLVPLDIAPVGSRIIIYGYGKVGKEYLEQIREYQYYDIVGVCASNFEAVKKKERYIPALSIKDAEYDYIIIAVSKEEMMSEIRETLTKHGVPDNRILWKKPKMSESYRKIQWTHEEVRF